MVRSTSLSLGIPPNPSPISSNVTSPTDPGSRASTPGGATGSGSQERAHSQPRLTLMESQMPPSHATGDPPLSPEFTSLPPFPESPNESPRVGQEPSKGFFANLKASKSSNKVNSVLESSIRQVSDDISRKDLDTIEGTNTTYARTHSPGSTSDLRHTLHDLESTAPADDSKTFLSADELRRTTQREQAQIIHRRPVGSPTRSDDAVRHGKMESSQMKKPKPRFSNLITRTRSVRTDFMLPPNVRSSSAYEDRGPSGLSNSQKTKSITPIVTASKPQPQLQIDGADESLPRLNTPITPHTPMSAPLPQERANYHDKNISTGPNILSTSRNRSADRNQAYGEAGQESRPSHSDFANAPSGGLREAPASSSHLFSNIKNTSSRAAGGLNKAGKGIFAKMGRSGSNTIITPEDQRYVCRIINLPLVEQTRKTRIAARLENSKDKTEFWMPALPWRCIDYLNFRGCEEEGLYRVPGSDREIRLWQKRFDQEGDINLFEEDNLYDINIIGSLFKSWLRELPTEILPKTIQTKIYKENPNAVEVPQMLKDELSLLPPWNYYLLFAITCHLSLLTAYSDKNRMTYSNLVICFQPCLKIDNFCFQFLVQQWRECWQGCWTEKDALEEEYRIMDGRDADIPGSSGNSSGGSTAVGAEERPVASSASNQPMHIGRPQQQQQQQQQQQNQQQQPKSQQGRPPALKVSIENDDHSSVMNGNGHPSTGHARAGSQLPELAPVQPLSPIGF